MALSKLPCEFVGHRMPDPAHHVHPRSIRMPCLILIVIPESRSDIRDPVPLRITALRERHAIPAMAGMA
jgi:hypothetical protein